MDLIWILVVIALIGLATWALIHYIPMPSPFPTLIVCVAVLFIILWILRNIAFKVPNVMP